MPDDAPVTHRTDSNRSPSDTSTITTAEAALRLSLSTRSVRNLIAAGSLDAEREGQRWLISAASVRDELERRRVGVASSTPSAFGAAIVAPPKPAVVDAAALRAAPPDRQVVSHGTLLGMITAIALLVVICSSLIARSQIAASPSGLDIPTVSSDVPADGFVAVQDVDRSTEPSGVSPDLLLLFSGAGIMAGAQLLAFGPWLIRSRLAAER